MRLRCDERRSRCSIPAHHTPATCCMGDISSVHGHYHMLCAPESVGGEGECAVRGQWAQQQQSDVGGGHGGTSGGVKFTCMVCVSKFS
jgi:hypothetical protein